MNRGDSVSDEELTDIPFNSLLGFSNFESKQTNPLEVVAINAFNSLLGFSNFESLVLSVVGLGLCMLSIPYWDFLILNRKHNTFFGGTHVGTFNSLLGFSNFESRQGQ